MSWKKMPSWLKGGVIGGIISFLSSLLIFLLMNSIGRGFGGYNIQTIIIFILLIFAPWQFFLGWDFALLGYDLNYNQILSHFLIYTIYSFLTWFIIGAVIGFIISKIKTKKFRE